MTETDVLIERLEKIAELAGRRVRIDRAERELADARAEIGRLEAEIGRLKVIGAEAPSAPMPCSHDWLPETSPCGDGTWEPTGDLICSRCGAVGYPCQECEGSGFVTVTVDRLTDEEDEVPCDECVATGVVVVEKSSTGPCPECGGEGTVVLSLPHAIPRRVACGRCRP